jgi:hypothetical protein
MGKRGAGKRKYLRVSLEIKFQDGAVRGYC